MHMLPVFTVIGADDVFKVARQLGDEAHTRADAEGNTSHRDVPVHEVCKSGEGREGWKGEGRRLGGNGIARPGPDHLIWDEREGGD